MATSNSNNLVNPNAREAMNRFKMEAAAEMGVHVCRPSSIFFDAHVAEENDWTFFHRSGGETLRGS